MLLRSGADATCKNVAGLTPLDALRAKFGDAEGVAADLLANAQRGQTKH